MKEENVIILIHKRLEGTISAAERRMLSEWADTSPDNAAFVEEIELAWELSSRKEFGFQPDLDTAMNRFQRSLEDQSKVVPMANTGRIRRRIMTVAAVAAALAGVLFVWNPFSDNVQWNQVSTVEGERQKVELPDGSTVWLNATSTLSYPQTFGAKRTVELTGEAFFDIAKDANHPFIINAKAANIEVLGTSFNVRAFDDEQKIVVAVRSGKVRFQPHRSSQNWLLTQHDKFTFDLSKKSFSQETDVTENDWSWHSNKLQFKKTKLRNVLQALERHYQLKIELSNRELYDCRSYSGTFENALVEDILSSMETIFNFKSKKQSDGSFLLTGGNCAKK